MPPRLIVEPDESGLCGQCCVAMAAGVSLKRVVKQMGKHTGGTYTKDVVAALRHFGVPCADRLRRVARSRPVWPTRSILVIHRPPEEAGGRKAKWHWLLAWDGKMYDPGNRWPEGYGKWRITSYLEILDADVRERPPDLR